MRRIPDYSREAFGRRLVRSMFSDDYKRVCRDSSDIGHMLRGLKLAEKYLVVNCGDHREHLYDGNR